MQKQISRIRRPVAVVTDSATALSKEMAEQSGLFIAPMEITIGGHSYADDDSDFKGNFYDLLRLSKTTPKTSAPRPSSWLKQFSTASKIADSIVCITLSSKVSASYDSAMVAAELALEKQPDTPIKIIDSETAAGSEALIALAAGRMAKNGQSTKDVESSAHYVKKRVRLLAYLDTLEYVWRSGRVPRVAVWATSLLNVKPVMEFSRGKVGNFGKPRSRRKAMELIRNEMGKSIGALPAHIAVMHADAEEEANRLHQMIKGEFNCAELFISSFPGFMGTHTGPGLVGAAFWADT